MEAVKNFIFLAPVTIGSSTEYLLGLVWVWLLCLGLWSAFTNSTLRARGRILWGLVIVLVPIVGLGAYCVYCLVTGDWTLVKQMGLFSESRRRTADTLKEG